MRINVKKLTDESLMQRACKFTLHSHQDTGVSLERMYQAGHTPMRTQLFWIEMVGIPTFVSVHFVRHNVGVSHFVQTNRSDRGGTGTTDRNTPVNHAMLINAEALVNMAHRRLCLQSHELTIKIFQYIYDAVLQVDPALAKHLVPMCVFRGGNCGEFGDCPRKVH